MLSVVRWTIAISALTWSALVGSAASQHEPLRVQTQDGLTFTLPATFRASPELTQARGSTYPFELAFTDAQGESDAAVVQVLVLRAPELATAEAPGAEGHERRDPGRPDDSLPRDEKGAPLVPAFTDTIRNRLGLQVADVNSSGYDAERGALWIQFRQRSSSQARSLLELGAADPAWQRISGGSLPVRAVACIVAAVLAGAPSVDASVVPTRAARAAEQCEQPTEVVQGYLDALGPGFFAPFEATFAVDGYFTRTALVMTVVVSQAERAQAAEAVAQQIRSSAKIAPEGRPSGTGPARDALATAQRIGRVCGAILGSLLGMLVFGTSLGFVLRKLGLSASRAAGIALASVFGVGLLSWLLAGPINLIALVQLSTYVVAGALGYRPLRRWLERRSPPRGGQGLLTDTRGLTTLEYSVLFVVVVVAGVVVWKQLGQSLVTTMSRETEKYSTALETSGSSSGPSTHTTAARHQAVDAPPTSAANSPTQSNTPGEPPDWFDRLKLATIDHPAVQQFTRDHPIATAIGKEVSVLAAETFIPGVAAFNAVRTLRDDKASGFDRVMAAATLATSVIPPVAAAIYVNRGGTMESTR